MTAERNQKEGRSLYEEFMSHARANTDVEEREQKKPEIKEEQTELARRRVIRQRPKISPRPEAVPPPDIERREETVIFKPVRKVEKPPVEIPQIKGDDVSDPAKARKPQKVSRFTEWVRKITDMLY